MNDVTTSKTFQERMFDRVRDQMGDLLTDEDLKKIVDTAMHKAFFEERNTGGYNNTVKPAVFVEMIENEMKSKVNTALSNWLKENPEIVEAAITKMINDGLYKCVLSALENRLNWPLQSLADQLRQKGIFN